jgi:hypothetical protein
LNPNYFLVNSLHDMHKITWYRWCHLCMILHSASETGERLLMISVIVLWRLCYADLMLMRIDILITPSSQ